MTRRTRANAQKPSHRTVTAPVQAIRPAPEVWTRALELAGGDRRRLQIDPDGSVLVKNPTYGGLLASFPHYPLKAGLLLQVMGESG